jgi:AsmA-like C-terminal region
MSATPVNLARARKTILHQGASFCLACAGLVGVVLAIAFVNLHWPYRYRNVEPLLQKVFASQIKIERYHRTYFPHPGFVADSITLRRNSAPNLPAVGTVTHLRVEGRWIDLLLLRDRVHLVSADGLHVIIPPAGSAANKEDFPPGSSNDFTGPPTVVEQLDLQNATLDLLRVGGGRYTFPIRRLLIGNLHQGETISYSLDMQNARPTGRIQAHGSFGPLLANKLEATPVTGDFTFTGVNLSEIHGLHGTFSAVGRFQGRLGEIEGSAQSSAPDFSVARGHRTLVEAALSCAVNGLNGNITLHAVDVRMGSSVIHAEGNIAGSPKLTSIDLLVKKGRVEDLLRPFLTSETPVTGPVFLHGHANLAAAGSDASFFERLTMSGAFSVLGERFTDTTTERNLTAFSQRAQGLKTAKDPRAELAVLPNVAATVSVRNGIAQMSPLMVHLPGAAVHLNGAFDLRNQDVRLTGDLRMQSDISHVTTGFKAILLKPLAPFFKKKGAGAVVPIAITGTPRHYKVSQNILPH